MSDSCWVDLSVVVKVSCSADSMVAYSVDELDRQPADTSAALSASTKDTYSAAAMVAQKVVLTADKLVEVQAD